ncbi:MAG: acyl carrier protein [Bacteroidales bacterium]|nr:acyl carrier protein [Bacteroidales bacterium]
MVMFEKVKDILVKQLRISDPSIITMDSEIKKNLGADSLDILQLLMKIEDEYGISIPDEKLATFKTVGDVVNFLESLEK